MIRYARLLDRLYLCALEWGWCAHNPLDDIKSTLMQPEPRARPSSLSTTDPSRVLAGLAVPNDMKGRRDVAMLTLAVAAGLRLAEIRTLRLTQLLETPGGLEVQPRAGAARVRNLTLGSAEADRLRAWLKERSTLSVHSPYVFPAKSGEMLPANTLYRRVRRLIEPAHGREGLEHYGLGVLRATYAKQIAQTHSTESTQQHLGHRRLASTRRLLDTLGIKAASIATLEPDSPEEPPSATERTR
jgi:site-specific recombinase XerC